MRRPLALCRGGLAAAAAVVLLTACGGSDEDSTASRTTSESSTTSAPTSSAPQADSEFCTQAAATLQRVIATLTSTDHSQVGPVLQQTAQEIQTIEPPAELADAWGSLVQATGEFAQISQIDFEDPAAYQQWMQQAGEIQTRYAESFSQVQTYLSTQCGISETESTDSASPTS